ncbi:MAG: S41 family peptidase [Gemmatimonadota bacterium]|nr:S41 family peptidase [Gemmatimonadota bacterium]
MMEQLPRVHRNLHHTTPAATFDSAAKALHERIPTLARHEIILELARIVALAGDGHTNIYPTRDAAIGFRTLPVALYLFRDGVYVRAAHRIHADLAGARVVMIGSVPIDEAYQRVRPYIGRDNEMGVKFFTPHLLAMPEVLHAIGLAPSPDSVLFDFEVGGARRSVWLRPVGPVELMPADADVSWRRKTGWVDAREKAPDAEPLWLSRDPAKALWWFTVLPGTRTLYAQINQVRNAPTETFADFTARLLAAVDSVRADRLVLDLRLNRGGNGQLLRPLVNGILKRPKVNERGKLVVLIGRSTWSAAQFLLNDLQKYADATFVGEPSGSKGNHYGDSRRITLPNSGITVRAATIYWQAWSPGDMRPWTAPDVTAELGSSDYARNHDPVLATALAYVPGPRLSEEIRVAIAAGDTARARERLEAFRSDTTHAYVDARPSLDSAAIHFLERRDYDRAIAVLELAVAEYPDVPRAYLNLSAAYAARAQAQMPAVAERAEPEP